MTLPEFEDFCEAIKHVTAVQRAKAHGIDISLIDENLRLTPTRKIRTYTDRQSLLFLT
jgi:hypothetical protein